MEKNPSEIEVGYGTARGDESLVVGEKAARQALAGITLYPVSAVLVFASVRYDLEELLSGIQSVVGDVPVFGASTAGEICNGRHEKSVVVAILASPYLTVRIGIGQGVSTDWRNAVHDAVTGSAIAPFFSPEDNTIWNEMTQQGQSAFGIIFSPGNTRYADSRGCEILEELKRLSLGRLPMFGGCAADDWQLETNYVLLGNRAHPDSMLIAVVQTNLQFGIAMGHGFQPTSRMATITSVSDHEVLELDGQSAADTYARLLGVSRESLEGKHLTLTTGRSPGAPDAYGQHTIHVASFFTPRGGVRFAQPLAAGTALTIMEPSIEDMLDAGKEALLRAVLRSGITNPAVIFVCSCALRCPFLGTRAVEEISRMRDVMPGVPVVGFYSFGEQGVTVDGVSRHNNNVISVLLLGQDLSYASMVAVENQRLRKDVEITVAQLESAEQLLRESHHELEKRVQERTAELVELNKELRREISERVRAEEGLRQSEERFKGLADASFEGIVISREGIILDANARYADITGYEVSDLIGMTIAELVTERCRDVASAKILSGNEETYESESLRKDGSSVPTLVQARAIPYKGSPARVASIKDISESKRSEHEQEALRAQLVQAQKMQAIGTLAGGIAHEFNNLLTIISGYAELLLADRNEAESCHADLQKIVHTARRGAELVKGLLTFSGKSEMKPRPVNLNHEVRQVKKLLDRTIPKMIEIELHLSDGLKRVEADSSQVEQALMNLALNASDAMPDGGRLTIETRNVALSPGDSSNIPIANPGEYVQLAVSDTGSGMDSETVGRIFEPFYTSTGLAYKKGLGLSVVHGIVQQHRGYITCESRPGQGTTFKIYFPASMKAAISASPAEETRPPRGTETILLVDDEELVRELGSRILERAGYQVLTAENGQDAADLYADEREKISLVILDLIMPKKGGKQCLESLLSIDPGVKVLIASGHSDADRRDEFVGAGARGFMDKPYRVKQLLQAVRKVLDAK